MFDYFRARKPPPLLCSITNYDRERLAYMPVYFYNLGEPYDCFTNFSRHGFVLDGLYWPTSEHYFQAQKFAGTPYAEQIRNAGSPREAFNLARIKGWPLRPDWAQVKDDVMRRAVRQKFASHPDIREVLLSTGDEILIENSPVDPYWGNGSDGKGLNRLGQILMEVRAEFRAAAK